MNWLPVLGILLLTAGLAGCSDAAANANGAEKPDFQDFDAKPTSTTGIIRGVIVDDAIRPIADATVTITNPEKSVKTNDKGLFVLGDLQAGTYFLTVSKPGYTSSQRAADVVAGVAEPDIIKILIQVNPAVTPFFDGYQFAGFITCGAAVVATSVGCNTFPQVGTAIGDRVYFSMKFDNLPSWTQGELIWKQTQPAGGEMIWEIVPQGSNTHIGYRETKGSPALAYINNATLEARTDDVMGKGITYRIFGGPHPTCTGVMFGCGVTMDQKLDVFVHNFYNFQPTEGWRFSNDGPPKLPY